MSCGYACVSCGRCRGKPRELKTDTICFRCGFENPPEASRCERCGLEIPRLPDADQANARPDNAERDPM